MKLKRTIGIVLSGAMLFGTSAFAKDNIYAYNKFVSTILAQQSGYCDFAASFAGKESEYDNVNNYFSGLISAFYDDIDGDFDNELVTVDSHGVAVYQAEENGVVFLGAIDKDLIANFGDSYANIFTAQEGRKKYIGLEIYGKAINSYEMYLYDLDPETDDFKKILSIERESNEDGTSENVWAKDKTYYSYTNGGGIQTLMNTDNYADCGAAALAALNDTVPNVQISQKMADRMESGALAADNFKLSNIASNIEQRTYIRATGLRFTEKPIVVFEDNSNLAELAVKPDIVTVTIDGQTLQFPTQDPVIVGEGTTLVPMRTIFEALGAEVDWQEENGVQTITATTADTTINMTINSQEFFVNGESKTLEVPAQLMNDKTMVPLRAISESFGCSVDWEQETKTVIIQSNN